MQRGAMFKQKLYRAVAGDTSVNCLVCHNTLFARRKVVLNSAGTELLGLAWADVSNVMLTCSNCGYCMEFMDKWLTLTLDTEH